MYVAPNKVQCMSPWLYLGYMLTKWQIEPQKLVLWKDSLKTLNDFQKLININWVRPLLGAPTTVLSHLFETLRGDPALDFPHHLTPQASKELQLIEQMLSTWYLNCFDPNFPVKLFIFPTPKLPSALLGRLNPSLRYLECMGQNFPPNAPSKTLSPFLDRITDIISRGSQTWHSVFWLWSSDHLCSSVQSPIWDSIVSNTLSSNCHGWFYWKSHPYFTPSQTPKLFGTTHFACQKWLAHKPIPWAKTVFTD